MSRKEPLPSVSALLTLPTLWQQRCSQSQAENQILPRHQLNGAPLQPGAVCKLPAPRAARPSLLCLAFGSLCFSSLGRLPQVGPMAGGALQMLQPLLHYSSPTQQGCCSARDKYRTSKTSKGKTRFWVPKEKKRHFCCEFKYSLAFFFKHKKLQTSQVTYLNSKTFQKTGNNTY